MSFQKPIYSCAHCRSIVENLNELFFVDDKTHYGFCSEDCIEKFLAPIYKYYEGIEKELRQQYDLVGESCEELVNDINLMEKVLKRPKEIYVLENHLGEDVYAFHTSVNEDFSKGPWLIVLCLVFEGQPSFIFVATCTGGQKFRQEFRIGRQIDDVQAFLNESIEEMELPFEDEMVAAQERSSDTGETEEIEVPQEVMDRVEQKKSELLATLLNERSSADIPYDNFHLYEQFLNATLEDPDEIYRDIDKEGEEIFTYVKAHDKEGVSFFYFVLCLNLGDDYTESGAAILPVLSFPSLDGQLSHEYRKGEKISGELKN